jgi:hypothetical protein
MIRVLIEMRVFAMKLSLLITICFLLVVSNFALANNPEVAIQYHGNSTYNGTAQIEVTGISEHVIIDLFDPSLLSAAPTKNDILLSTCDDYYVADFIRDFPGEKLLTRVGEIKRDGVYIRGIASNRDDKEEFLNEHGTNYIFVVEVAGLRIADFGYIGQSKLTPEQMDQLGRVDIAFIPFCNFRNGMGIDDRRGFNLVNQVRPRVVIPTGLDIQTAKYAAQQWPGFFCDQKELKITQDQLPEKTSVLLMGPDAKRYGKICKVPKFNQ